MLPTLRKDLTATAAQMRSAAIRHAKEGRQTNLVTGLRAAVPAAYSWRTQDTTQTNFGGICRMPSASLTLDPSQQEEGRPSRSSYLVSREGELIRKAARVSRPEAAFGILAFSLPLHRRRSPLRGRRQDESLHANRRIGAPPVELRGPPSGRLGVERGGGSNVPRPLRSALSTGLSARFKHVSQARYLTRFGVIQTRLFWPGTPARWTSTGLLTRGVRVRVPRVPPHRSFARTMHLGP